MEDNLIIEEYVEGREFSVGVIDYKALPIIEIAPIQGFYDYKNKYKSRQCSGDLSCRITGRESQSRCSITQSAWTEVLGTEYLLSF